MGPLPVAKVCGVPKVGVVWLPGNVKLKEVVAIDRPGDRCRRLIRAKSHGAGGRLVVDIGVGTVRARAILGLVVRLHGRPEVAGARDHEQAHELAGFRLGERRRVVDRQRHRRRQPRLQGFERRPQPPASVRPALPLGDRVQELPHRFPPRCTIHDATFL
jgi:hypothetical protein